MKRFLLALGLAAALGGTLYATAPTYVEVHHLVHFFGPPYTHADYYYFTAYDGPNGTGNVINTTTPPYVMTAATIYTYYNAGCSCYKVPLSLFTTAVDGMSVKVDHYVWNTSYHLQESVIEILN